MPLSFSKGLYSLVDLLLRIPGVLPVAQWLLTPRRPNLKNKFVGALALAEKAVASSTHPDPTRTEIQKLDHRGWAHDKGVHHQWQKQRDPSPSKDTFRTLSVLHMNVMMDVYSTYIPGVIHSGLRYFEILKRLFEGSEPVADVICFNEVDQTFLGLLSNHAKVQETYVMTDCLSNNDEPTFHRSKHGVVVLLKKSLHVNAVHTIRSVVRLPGGKNKKSRASVVIRMELNGRPFTLVACHFEAMTSNFEPRCQQLFDIYQLVSATGSRDEQALILGDFNFHQEDESVAIVQPYVDLWKYIHPNKPEEEGFTWDSQKNELIKRVVLRVDTRRMRLDRAILSMHGDKRNALQPNDMSLYGTEPFRLPNGQMLHPSDHFGLLCKFDVLL